MANKDLNFIKGLFIGSIVSAGTVFLLKTEKGKEIRKKMRKEYPEVFAEIDDIKDKLFDRVDDLKEDMGISSEKPVLENTTEKLQEIADNVKSSAVMVKSKLTSSPKKTE